MVEVSDQLKDLLRELCTPSTDVKLAEITDAVPNLFATIDADTIAFLRKLLHPCTAELSLVVDKMASDQRLYLSFTAQPGQKCLVTGILKIGPKKLYVANNINQYVEIYPVCCLDFYVHASHQRKGIGIALFSHCLEVEQTVAHAMAYDKPSNNLRAFLRRHFGFSQPIDQANNFVVYPSFWDLPKQIQNVGRHQVEQTADNTPAGRPSRRTSTPEQQTVVPAGSNLAHAHAVNRAERPSSGRAVSSMSSNNLRKGLTPDVRAAARTENRKFNPVTGQPEPVRPTSMANSRRGLSRGDSDSQGNRPSWWGSREEEKVQTAPATTALTQPTTSAKEREADRLAAQIRAAEARVEAASQALADAQRLGVNVSERGTDLYSSRPLSAKNVMGWSKAAVHRRVRQQQSGQ